MKLIEMVSMVNDMITLCDKDGIDPCEVDVKVSFWRMEDDKEKMPYPMADVGYVTLENGIENGKKVGHAVIVYPSVGVSDFSPEELLVASTRTKMKYDIKEVN